MRLESDALALELDGKHAQAEILRHEITRCQHASHEYDAEANIWRVGAPFSTPEAVG